MSPTRTIYLAGDYARRDELAAYARELEGRGWDCTARWLTAPPAFRDVGIGGELFEADEVEAAVRVAREDLQDVAAADFFVQFTTGEKARGGRHVELGAALAMKEAWPARQVIVVGPRENVFHYAPGVVHLGQADLRTWLDGFTSALAAT